MKPDPDFLRFLKVFSPFSSFSQHSLSTWFIIAKHLLLINSYWFFKIISGFDFSFKKCIIDVIKIAVQKSHLLSGKWHYTLYSALLTVRSTAAQPKHYLIKCSEFIRMLHGFGSTSWWWPALILTIRETNKWQKLHQKRSEICELYVVKT